MHLVPCRDRAVGGLWFQRTGGGRDSLHAAPDESVTTRGGEPGVNDQIVRCWKVEAGVECLNVRRIGTFTIGEAYARPRLDTEIHYRSSGFSCDITYDDDGAVSRHLEYLHAGQNSLAREVKSEGPAEPPISKAFAERFAQEHSLTMERKWFDCGMLADAIRKGGIDVLTTAAIDRQALFGN